MNFSVGIYLFKVTGVGVNSVFMVFLLLTSGISMVVFDQIIAGWGRIVMT